MESAVIYDYHCSKEDIDALKRIYKYGVYAYFSPLSCECEHMFFNRPLDTQLTVGKTVEACWGAAYPCFKEYLEWGEEKFKEKLPEVWEVHYKEIIEEFGHPIEFGQGYPYWISKLLLSAEDQTTRNVRIINEEARNSNGGDNLDWYVREGFITGQQKNDIERYLERNSEKIRRMLRGIDKPTQIR